METHPVPQNVTAFEFHLIGNMTMRQFGYLAVGLTLAYIVFAFFASSAPYVAYPIIAILSITGAAYAFLPIMDRPLDHWTVAFIKAITKPTMRRYESARLGSQDPKFKDRLNLYLQQLQASEEKRPKRPSSLSIHSVISGPQPAPEEAKLEPAHPINDDKEKSADDAKKEGDHGVLPKVPEKATSENQPEHKNPDPVANFLNDLHTLANKQPEHLEEQPKHTPPVAPLQDVQVIPHPAPAIEQKSLTTEELLQHPAPVPSELPTKEDLNKTVHLAREAQSVQNQIIAAEKQIDTIKSGAATAGVDPERYTQQFQSVLTTLQKLNQQAREISHQLAELSTAEKPSTLINEPVVKPNIIPTLTLTSIPNILNGIVTDAQGNYIEGAIIVAHDKQGLPVRALKTNKLGQFIAATPLSSGIYTISVEKDDLSFNVIQVELNDKILNPIVISAKKGGV